jgi:preprotein translocase subunit SecE
MASFTQYLKDTRGELRHVAWPTQKQTIIYTALVIAISLLIAAYLGVLDYALTQGLEWGLDVETTQGVGEFTITPETSGAGEIEVTPVGGESGETSPIDIDVIPAE